MRLRIALLALTVSTPVYAQTIGNTSGATSMVGINAPPPPSTTHLITAPTVVAPGLAAAGVETCLGSAAGGLSVMGGGVTFGSTKVDEGCTIRLLARQMYAFGLRNAALALMCEDQHVVLAMIESGTPCPPQAVRVAENSPPAVESPGGGLFSFLPPLAFAEDQTSAISAPQTEAGTDTEQALFDRESNMK
jgi:hypothetical protein